MTENTAKAKLPPNADPQPNVVPRPDGSGFALTILGAGSATPMLGRHHTAQLLQHQHDLFLIDCGEGTQYRLLEARAHGHYVRGSKLKHIFISHLHGDHFFGLAPLISSLNLAGRTDELTIIGPPDLQDVLTCTFRAGGSWLGFPLHFIPTNPDQPGVVLDLPHLTVETVPLDHRIACTGFIFREKPGQPHLLREKLPAHVAIDVLRTLKAGRDVVDANGNVAFRAADYTEPAPAPRAYAYCSDTRFNEALVPYIRGVDTLYHEATFLDDSAPRAGQVYHATARQAAEIARQADVGTLLLGHFSSRYKTFDGFLDEARAVFPATHLALEGQQYAL